MKKSHTVILLQTLFQLEPRLPLILNFCFLKRHTVLDNKYEVPETYPAKSHTYRYVWAPRGGTLSFHTIPPGKCPEIHSRSTGRTYDPSRQNVS